MPSFTVGLADEVSGDIRPGDDLYRYVNQKWLGANPVPPDKAQLVAFTVLQDDNTERLRKLLEAGAPVAESEPGDVALVRQLYRTAMDEAAIERAGLAPVQPMLAGIEALDDPTALRRFLAEQHGRGNGLVWGLYVDVDDKDSRRYVARIAQGGLGLPDRDYYFESGERFETTRAKYRTFLADLFALLGCDDGAARAERVVQLETLLAAASDTAAGRRDARKKYNPYSLRHLDKRMPGLDWREYFGRTGLKGQTRLIISQPGFVRAVLELLDAQPMEAWRDYLAFHCILPLLPALPRAFDELRFSFYGTVLGGAECQEPRYRRAITSCMHLLPEPIGRLYVAAHFDEAAKAAIYDLVEHMKVALRGRIARLSWMSETTKNQAYQKLDTFIPLLGYPDKWRDYSLLQLVDTYAGNVMAIDEHEWQYWLQRLDKPVDRGEWFASPAVVNAFYWRNANSITFPAGILQPPFFDARGDVAANYGGIGVVIGHEMTHGFDDQGSRYDADGNMRPWWTDADCASFDARARHLEERFNGYEVEGCNVNGKLTLGENIADLGGTLIAFDALQHKLQTTGARGTLDGFTPEQRFFMSLARIWRGNTRPELALQLLMIDTHSPGYLRVNAVATNVDAFYEAFNVNPDATLYTPPDARVRIW